MYLKTLSCRQFKNLEEVKIEFSHGINCLTGPNGSGKTNLLDAVHLLSLTKSAFGVPDSGLMMHTKSFYSVSGAFVVEDREEVMNCVFQKGKKKIITCDNSEYEKLADHIGKYPIVLIAPDDTDIIRGGSEPRRKFFDGVMAQSDRSFLDVLMKYNRILRERNKLLKSHESAYSIDPDLFEAFDRQLIEAGQIIIQKRTVFSEKFKPIFDHRYRNISEENESASLHYKPDIDHHEYEEKLKKSFQKDSAFGFTTRGIHRDDFVFEIDGYSLKKYGSQGQRKSFLIALKMTQYDVIKEIKGRSPVLLLDDIFDKLDDRRISRLIDPLVDEAFGQVIITDARRERTERLLEGISSKINLFDVENGKVRQKD